MIVGELARKRDLLGQLDFENLDANDGAGFIDVVGDAADLSTFSLSKGVAPNVVHCGP